MTRTPTAKEGDQIVPRTKRKVNREEAALKAREDASLAELLSLGFSVTLYEPRRWEDSDPLRGIESGWHTGICYAVAYSTDGRRRNFSGVSATQLLDNARLFLAYQDRMKPEAPNRFVVAKDEDEISAPQVFHRPGSEQIARDRRRKLVSFQSGFAVEVDAHGDPIGDRDS